MGANQEMSAYAHWHMQNCRCRGPAQSFVEIQESLVAIQHGAEETDANATESDADSPA